MPCRFDGSLKAGAIAIQANHTACRIANKVAMHLVYAATTARAGDAGPLISEALLLTLEIIQLADVETISKRYTELCENLPDSPTDPWEASKFGAQWTADACQQLRDIGFQEKWIAVLGDQLDRWSPCFVAAPTLTRSIQNLVTECSVDAVATTQTLLARDSLGAPATPKLLRFSNAVCGLAIVAATLDELDQQAATGQPSAADDSFTSRALASFGAQLIVDRRPHAHRSSDPSPSDPS